MTSIFYIFLEKITLVLIFFRVRLSLSNPIKISMQTCKLKNKNLFCRLWSIMSLWNLFYELEQMQNFCSTPSDSLIDTQNQQVAELPQTQVRLKWQVWQRFRIQTILMRLCKTGKGFVHTRCQIPVQCTQKEVMLHHQLIVIFVILQRL